MKTVPALLATDLASSVTSFCHLLKIIREDGVIKGFTDHDNDLVVSGVTYEASTAHNVSALTMSASTSVDNLDLESVIDSDGITLADLEAGKYDFAEWILYLVNWRDVSHGTLVLCRGRLGETEFGEMRYKAEARSLYEAFNQNIGELVGPDCLADFGDSRCGVVVYACNGTVSAIIDRARFRSTTAHSCVPRTHKDGMLEWKTGNNAGIFMDVRDYSFDGVTSNFVLATQMPKDIQVGDTYRVTTGCDKTRTQCVFHNNIINFRGFPDLPGLGEMTDWGYHG